MNYKEILHQPSGIRINVSTFTANNTTEYHLCLVPNSKGDFAKQLSKLEEAYSYALHSLNIPAESAIFRRLFVSDYANQLEILKESCLVSQSKEYGAVAVSIIEQAPLPEKKIALWAYHISNGRPPQKEVLDAGNILLKRGDLSHLWTVGLGFFEKEQVQSPERQTRHIFDEYISCLKNLGADLEKNTIRTWLFVQNVDVNYAGMVKERCKIFEQQKLTDKTHYITSTGIEGRHSDPRRLVLFDAYAILGIKKEQVTYLEAPDQLGSTSLYGVTFERGVKVEYGDRNHIFIAGTASIEPSGKTIHVGDVKKQIERTFKNIDGLLMDGNAKLSDISQMIVYLRDVADRELIESYLEVNLPNTPYVMVHAPVCRPDWLVEVECMAITPNSNASLQNF